MEQPKQSTLEKLCREMMIDYISDSSAPSVKIAYLPSTDEWYCSIERYAGQFGKGAFKVCASKGKTLGEAVKNCANLWAQNFCPRRPEVKTPPTFNGETSEDL